MTKKSDQICPYCGNLILLRSEDHIFSDHLGGRTKIPACQQCNSTFGHTFEGAVAPMLQGLHVSISSWGLPLLSASPIWKRAHEYNGMTIDYSLGVEGLKARLSRPLSERDDSGKITSLTFADQSAAEKAARHAIRKGKAKTAAIQKIRIELPSGLPFIYQIDPNLMRVALKMSIALSTKLPNFSGAEIADARSALSSRAVPVAIAFDSYEHLDAFRPPLSHLIYVERSPSRIYSVVQFFGVIQLFCRLNSSAGTRTSSAVLGVLDPVTGDEQISTLELLDLPEPPSFMTLPAVEHSKELWSEKFRQGAIARGAKHPPKLKGELVFGNSERDGSR
jgi:hypothetical protein